jgi:hypothetical protein
VTAVAQWVTAVAQWVTAVAQLGDGRSSMGDGRSSMGDGRSSIGDGRSSMGDGRSSIGLSARYTLLCCGFDSRRHTQILYKENIKMLYGAQKNKGKKKCSRGNIL